MTHISARQAARSTTPRVQLKPLSLLIALAFAQGALSLEEAWSAAHVDEDWNLELWGRDELALERRAARFAEMQAAATVLQAAA